MSRRLWLLRGWLSGWWLEARCAWRGHPLVVYAILKNEWRCRCGVRRETPLTSLQRITRS